MWTEILEFKTVTHERLDFLDKWTKDENRYFRKTLKKFK